MIHFAMVTYDEINRIQINFRFQIINELRGMRFPYSINEDRLLLFNQIGILARPIINGVIGTVKLLAISQSILPTHDTLFFNVLSHNNLHVL